MATIPLTNPFETRVLPALPRFEQAAPQAAPVSQARLRLVLALRHDEQIEIWDDRIVAPDHVYPLDSFFDARVTTDWRAPLTIEPDLGLAFLDHRERWNLYVPADEAQIWQATYVLRGVSEARGVALAHLSESAPTTYSWRAPADTVPVRAPALAQRPATVQEGAAHPYMPAWSAPQASLARGLAADTTGDTPSDSLLMAIAHLSVLFMPALLPLAIWFSLRHAMPRVAEQAREALRFQLGVVALALALLGYAAYGALRHGVAGAATIGLLGFVILMSASVVYAFFAATQSARGRDFIYFHFFR